ncbi:ferredoxin [Rhodococcus aetherivorans]
MKIEGDRELCIGSGNCAFWLPEVFELDAESKVFVRDPGAAPVERILEMEAQCPVGAIKVKR